MTYTWGGVPMHPHPTPFPVCLGMSAAFVEVQTLSESVVRDTASDLHLPPQHVMLLVGSSTLGLYPVVTAAASSYSAVDYRIRIAYLGAIGMGYLSPKHVLVPALVVCGGNVLECGVLILSLTA